MKKRVILTAIAAVFITAVFLTGCADRTTTGQQPEQPQRVAQPDPMKQPDSKVNVELEDLGEIELNEDEQLKTFISARENNMPVLVNYSSPT